jgi:ketosteroid isomerase-like protein
LIVAFKITSAQREYYRYTGVSSLLERQGYGSSVPDLAWARRGVVNPTMEMQILAVEDQLRAAMLSSDVNALNELLAAELIFTNHFGALLGKEADLAAHRSGMLKIQKLEPSEQTIRFAGEVAIVSVRTRVEGTYAGNPANGDFRFTRVWALSPSNTWQVIAAHSALVA